ncbi:MAG: hypothetical protein WA364_26035 [Candidatus Nitrosopolaris sp.]
MPSILTPLEWKWQNPVTMNGNIYVAINDGGDTNTRIVKHII